MHDEAARYEDTDWREILGLYELLESVAPGPMVTLNRIVAVAMVMARRSAWSNWLRWRPIPGSPDTIESTPSAHICSTRQVTTKPP